MKQLLTALISLLIFACSDVSVTFTDTDAGFDAGDDIDIGTNPDTDVQAEQDAGNGETDAGTETDETDDKTILKNKDGKILEGDFILSESGECFTTDGTGFYWLLSDGTVVDEACEKYTWYHYDWIAPDTIYLSRHVDEDTGNSRCTGPLYGLPDTMFAYAGGHKRSKCEEGEIQDGMAFKWNHLTQSCDEITVEQKHCFLESVPVDIQIQYLHDAPMSID